MIRTSSPHRLTRFAVGAIAALTASSGLVTRPGVTAASSPNRPLTNLAHLDLLGAEVSPPAQAGHTTYLAEPRSLRSGCCGPMPTGRPTGPIGGSVAASTTRPPTRGARAPSTPTTSRARPWSTCGTGSRPEPSRAAGGLPATAGADLPADRRRAQRRQRGAVDAARRHAEPERRAGRAPDPSDSGPSYWLARTIWALGEAYPAFRDSDPAFAGFLRDRLDLALARSSVRSSSTTAMARHRRCRRTGLAHRRRRRRHGRGAPRTGAYVQAATADPARSSFSSSSVRAWPPCALATPALAVRRRAPVGACPKRSGTHGAAWRRPAWPRRPRSPGTGHAPRCPVGRRHLHHAPARHRWP